MVLIINQNFTLERCWVQTKKTNKSLEKAMASRWSWWRRQHRRQVFLNLSTVGNKVNHKNSSI